jgi:tetratricopeptide (TPR) repeat protein
LDLVKVQRSTWHFHEAQQLLLRILALCKTDQEHLAAVLLQLADTQIALGEFAAAIDTLQRFATLDIAPPSAPQHEAAVLGAHALAQAGDREHALALLAEAEKLTEPGDAQRTLRLAQVQALSYALFGSWGESSVAAQRAANAARSLGQAQKEAAYRHYEGEALTHLGQYAKAFAAFRGSLALARDIGAERWINKNRMLLGFLEAREGSESAGTQVRQCLAWAEERREAQDVAKGHLLSGLLLRHEGNDVAAQRELSLARQVAVAIGHRLLISECDAALAG